MLFQHLGIIIATTSSTSRATTLSSSLPFQSMPCKYFSLLDSRISIRFWSLFFLFLLASLALSSCSLSPLSLEVSTWSLAKAVNLLPLVATLLVHQPCTPLMVEPHSSSSFSQVLRELSSGSLVSAELHRLFWSSILYRFLTSCVPIIRCCCCDYLGSRCCTGAWPWRRLCQWTCSSLDLLQANTFNFTIQINFKCYIFVWSSFR